MSDRNSNNIKSLTAMGFEESKVRRALDSSHNDFDTALDQLTRLQTAELGGRDVVELQLADVGDRGPDQGQGRDEGGTRGNDAENENTQAENNENRNDQRDFNCDCSCDCATDINKMSKKWEALDYQTQQRVQYISAGACCIGFLLMVILIPASIRDVHHDDWAIRYDDLTNDVFSGVYVEGRYVVTPETKMFEYKRVVQQMDFKNLECLTSNGIVMTLEVAVQYKIPRGAVHPIFEDFGKASRFQRYIRLVGSASIRDSCGAYEAEDFYLLRSSIQYRISSDMVANLRAARTRVNVTTVVLTQYAFPDELIVAIRAKRAAENDIDIAENEREGELTEAYTSFLEAEITAEKLMIEAQAEVTSILVEADAEATAINEVWISRKNVYESVMSEMNMTGDEFVHQYLSSSVMQTTSKTITMLYD